MALKGSYEYECMRAELLEIEKPDYEEFMKAQAEREAAEAEAREIELLKESEIENEEFKDANTKMDDLNNILKSTQTKINNFTTPLSKFIKTKLSSSFDYYRRNSSDQINTDPTDAGTSSIDEKQQQVKEEDEKEKLKPENDLEKEDTQQASKHLNYLDSLTDKMERAQINMELQNKKMKSLLKK